MIAGRVDGGVKSGGMDYKFQAGEAAETMSNTVSVAIYRVDQLER